MKDLSTGFYRSLYDIGASVTGGLLDLAHRFFLSKDEAWLTDLSRKADISGHYRDGIILFAPSAGEVTSSSPLIKSIHSKSPGLPILICASTASGLKAAIRENLEVFRVTQNGSDYYKRLIDRIGLKGLVIVQVAHPGGLPIGMITAFSELKKPVVVVNGYLPAVDIEKTETWSWSRMKNVLLEIDIYCMQTQADADRLMEWGVDKARITVTGNMKFDSALESGNGDENSDLAKELGIDGTEPIVVAGSTHEGEEEAILLAVRRAGNARLIVAPRSLDRSSEIVEMVSKSGLSACLRSRITGRPDVIVLDTMGELRRIYSIATIVFVGGTLAPIGGHNVLEPAALGKPVLFGPHTHHTSGVAEMLVDAGGAMRVESREELADKLGFLLNNESERKRIGEKAAAVIKGYSGAAEKCAEIILQHLGTE